ncbi:hypothetical protein N9W17_01390 [Jannaschia sp.]|nr:hypothetical protein [Jannaschia sp.]
MTQTASETPIETGQKKAEDTADAVKSRAASLKSEAQRAASDMAQGAKSRVEAEVSARGNAARDTVATAVEDTAETLRTAAERMSDGTPQSEAVHRAANTVYGVAEQIRETSAATIVDDVTTFARRHPSAFLAGAAFVGFAAGRFLKASSRATPAPVYPVPAHARPVALRTTAPAPMPAARPTPMPTAKGA